VRTTTDDGSPRTDDIPLTARPSPPRSPATARPTVASAAATKNGTQKSWDACNVHAMCYVCANADGSMNKYCEAVLQVVRRFDVVRRDVMRRDM
jgi:hypothetical protein